MEAKKPVHWSCLDHNNHRLKIKAENKNKTVAAKSKEKKVTGQAKTKAAPKIKKSTTKDK